MREFEVEIICKVRKSVICLCDTEEETREKPRDHAVYEKKWSRLTGKLNE